MTNPDRALDLALRLAANVAANTIMAAAHVHRAAHTFRLALSERATGFSNREAGDFLSGADVLAAAEEEGRQIQEQADAAVVAELIDAHVEDLVAHGPYVYIRRSLVPALATRIAEYISEK